MNSAVAILGSAFVFLAALIKPWAYNQGFYNAFLTLGAGAGLVMMGSINLWLAGIALAMFATLSMVLAATVLITSQPKMARAAAIQGVPPLLGILFLVLALTVR